MYFDQWEKHGFSVSVLVIIILQIGSLVLISHKIQVWQDVKVQKSWAKLGSWLVLVCFI